MFWVHNHSHKIYSMKLMIKLVISKSLKIIFHKIKIIATESMTELAKFKFKKKSFTWFHSVRNMSSIRKNKNMIYFLHETDNDNLAILWILGELLNLYHPEHINYRHRKGNVVMTLCNFETKENTPIVVLLKSDKSLLWFHLV